MEFLTKLNLNADFEFRSGFDSNNLLQCWRLLIFKMNELLIGTNSAEIFHATELTAADPFVALRIGDRQLAFFDAREYEVSRAHLQKTGRQIELQRLEPFTATAATLSPELGSLFERTVIAILQKYDLQKIAISAELPCSWTQVFARAGIDFEITSFAKNRLHKTSAEISKIISTQKSLDEIFAEIKKILERSEVAGEHLALDGEILTSERLKKMIKKMYLERDLSWEAGMIVASGEQTTQPHNMGSGPLLAGESIIVDLFPRSENSLYFSDMTRTFCKGQPRAEMAAIYDAARQVQAETVDFVEIGMTGNEIFDFTMRRFTELGFVTEPGVSGFVHGVGHGLGLEIHEDPFIRQNILQKIEAGMVFTVEPGLYYPGIGGARIEDVIVIHSDGRKENITQFEREFVVK